MERNSLATHDALGMTRLGDGITKQSQDLPKASSPIPSRGETEWGRVTKAKKAGSWEQPHAHLHHLGKPEKWSLLSAIII